jgi:hypothetical protein
VPGRRGGGGLPGKDEEDPFRHPRALEAANEERSGLGLLEDGALQDHRHPETRLDRFLDGFRTPQARTHPETSGAGPEQLAEESSGSGPLLPSQERLLEKDIEGERRPSPPRMSGRQDRHQAFFPPGMALESRGLGPPLDRREIHFPREEPPVDLRVGGDPEFRGGPSPAALTAAAEVTLKEINAHVARGPHAGPA